MLPVSNHVYSSRQPEDLKAYVPVFIPECRIFPVKAEECESEGPIRVRSRKSGLPTQRIDSTLLSSNGFPIVELKNARVTLFNGRSARNSQELHGRPKRHPCLRVQWKPDIQRLAIDTKKQFADYVAQYVREQPLEHASSDQIDAIGAVLDLIGHKNPRMHVLVLGEFTSFEERWKGVLGDGTAFPRFRVWDNDSLEDDRLNCTRDAHARSYDVIILPTVSKPVVPLSFE